MPEQKEQGQSRYYRRKEKNDEYRRKIMRFTFQLSLHDGEVREWFEQHPDKGAYLKSLILADKEQKMKELQEEQVLTDTEIEKRMAGNYEITHAVRIGGREVVLGVDNASAKPYFCAFYQTHLILGEYSECMVGDNYAEMMGLFGRRIQEQAGKVLAEQKKTTVPLEPFTASDCYPNDYAESIEGKIVAVKAGALAPEYRTADHQLVYVTGGNGSHANAFGNACFCINLYSGRHIRWERYDIQGEVRPERLPEWAVERLTAVQKEQAKKEHNRQDKEAR